MGCINVFKTTEEKQRKDEFTKLFAALINDKQRREGIILKEIVQNTTNKGKAL